MVEQLLAEATADRLINPAGATRTIEVKSATLQPREQTFNERSYPRRSFEVNRSRPFQGTSTSRSRGFDRQHGIVDHRPIPSRNNCFNCGGVGHLARQCPSPRTRTPDSGRRVSNNRVSSPFRGQLRRSVSANVVHLPPDSSHELLQARDQIQALSLSLQEKQAALEQSDARVNALMKRNDELASSTFGRPATSSSRVSRNIPDVRLLLPCVMMLANISPSDALSSSAWLCPRSPSDVLARVPLSYNCSRIIPQVDAKPEPMSVHIFRPNTQRYDTAASLCRIVTRSVTFSVNFFGARTESHHEDYQIVSLEACKLMMQHHRCEHGTMTENSGSWATTNELTFDWPSAPFGCCSEQRVSVSNCYLVNTIIHMRHGSEFPDSPAGDLHQCTYAAGSCTMQDGSMLVWTPSQEESCQYISVTKMKGHRLGDIWISDSKEFALSWRDDSDHVHDCGKELTISDQGYAVMSVHRIPRSADAKVGLVTSNQLAAQLLAVEDTVEMAVSALFRHALSALCDRTNLLALSLHASLAANPTLTVRRLLDRHDLAASYLGNDLIQIHRCMVIPPKHYRVMPFNGTCYTKPQVEFSLSSGTSMRMFIDSMTMVLTHEAQQVDCLAAHHFYFAAEGSFERFDAITGETSPVTKIQSIGLPSTVNSSVIALPLTIFHNLVLTNLSELTRDHQLQELWSTVNQDHLLHATRAVATVSHESTPTATSNFLSPWS
ncbi:hypothetical protein Y032_0017g3228 [Ancylostoma ceylanicum]|uniref:CCHC-type domain-containing protein n=1 Tax=Ancylostoma ceylanicum TaxID=53326 RepID=A0A016V5E7_9BILA|nr:hypothetical protein Y032_0017g3228 [Ancylostoma ceylanicum]